MVSNGKMRFAVAIVAARRATRRAATSGAGADSAATGSTWRPTGQGFPARTSRRRCRSRPSRANGERRPNPRGCGRRSARTEPSGRAVVTSARPPGWPSSWTGCTGRSDGRGRVRPVSRPAPHPGRREWRSLHGMRLAGPSRRRGWGGVQTEVATSGVEEAGQSGDQFARLVEIHVVVGGPSAKPSFSAAELISMTTARVMTSIAGCRPARGPARPRRRRGPASNRCSRT